MKQKTITIYYIVLVTLVGVSVLQTVFEGSLHVAHGKKISMLTQKQQMLKEKRADLQLNLNEEVSLAEVTKFAENNNFQLMTTPSLVIRTSSTTVASR